jgi:IS30 family transposase
LQHLTFLVVVCVAYPRLPDQVRRSVLLASLTCVSYREVAERFSISTMSVHRIRHDPVVRAELYAKRGARLCLSDREEISLGLIRGWSFERIGVEIGRHKSTISREVGGVAGRESYRAVAAHEAALERAGRPKPTKFEQHRRLAVVVETWLEEQQWSPEQISARLRVEFPDDETMRVSHETIYQALYVYGRGGLRKEHVRYLRSQRSGRRSRSVTARNRQPKICDMVMIAERPDEIEQRLVPGHWEGDLIMGTNNGSQIATLVERTTGLVMLGRLDNKQAPTITRCLQERIATLPDYLRRSITWDQGSEMADHRTFTIETGIPVYFCDPHAPWQRGSNENINGLLRQYLPRNTDLSRHTQADLDAIADKLNHRPRKRHQFLTPLEVFDKLVLH